MPEHDHLMERTVNDLQRGDRNSFQKDIQDILLRDTNLADPANRDNAAVGARLRRDGEALHAAGLDNKTLRALGFPVVDAPEQHPQPMPEARRPEMQPAESNQPADKLIQKTIQDVHSGDRQAVYSDLMQILSRDAGITSPPGVESRLQKDHELLRATGFSDQTLVKLGFPMPEIKDDHRR